VRAIPHRGASSVRFIKAEWLIDFLKPLRGGICHQSTNWTPYKMKTS